MIDLRKIRSLLVVPGHDRRKIAKARTCGADLIVFDLEDAVPEGAKEMARAIVRENATARDAVRVNGAATRFFRDDIRVVESLGAVVMVPKVEVADLAKIAAHSAILTIESPSAVLDARAISAHSAMVAFGRADFMGAIGILDPFAKLIEHAMLQVAMAAHAEGKPSSDGPCYANDESILAAEIARARGAAFTSKGCLHPRQIAAVSVGMSCSAEEMRLAALFMGAEAPEGMAVFDFHGTAISPPLLAAARKVASNG